MYELIGKIYVYGLIISFLTSLHIYKKYMTSKIETEEFAVLVVMFLSSFTFPILYWIEEFTIWKEK